MSHTQRDERKRLGSFYRGFDPSKPKRATFDHLHSAAVRCAQSLVLGIETLSPSAQAVVVKLITPRIAWRIGFVLSSWYVLNGINEPITVAARRFIDCTALASLHRNIDQPVRQSLQSWIQASYEASDISQLSADKSLLSRCIDTGALAVLASVLLSEEYPQIAVWMAKNSYRHSLDRMWESVLTRTSQQSEGAA